MDRVGKVVQIHGVEAMSDYRRAMEHASPTAKDRYRANEAIRRLRQLDWLLIEIQRRDLDVAAHWNKELSDQNDYYQALDEMRLLADAFYFIAWRAREVIQGLPAPALKGFDPRGVRSVRNRI